MFKLVITIGKGDLILQQYRPHKMHETAFENAKIKKEDYMSDGRVILDTATGEVLKELNDGDYIRTKSQDKHYQKAQYRRNLHNEYGNFVFLVFQYGEKLLPTIKEANLTRLIYLATYCNYENELKVGYKSMDKKMMKKIMKLSENVFYGFVAEITKAKILIEKDGKLMLNEKVFFKGVVPKNIELNFTRINIQGVRTLYETADSASYHKFLSYAFKLIPYTNKEWNIICFNPEETDKDKIMPCSKKDILDLIGIKNHGEDVFSKMKSYRFHGKNLFSVLINNETTVFINPKVFYGGSRYKEVEIVAFGS